MMMTGPLVPRKRLLMMRSEKLIKTMLAMMMMGKLLAEGTGRSTARCGPTAPDR